MDKNTGLFLRAAFWNASGPHGNQSTGLWACCRRYGDFSWMRRLVNLCSPFWWLTVESSFPGRFTVIIHQRGGKYFLITNGISHETRTNSVSVCCLDYLLDLCSMTSGYTSPEAADVIPTVDTLYAFVYNGIRVVRLRSPKKGDAFV